MKWIFIPHAAPGNLNSGQSESYILPRFGKLYIVAVGGLRGSKKWLLDWLGNQSNSIGSRRANQRANYFESSNSWGAAEGLPSSLNPPDITSLELSGTTGVRIVQLVAKSLLTGSLRTAIRYRTASPKNNGSKDHFDTTWSSVISEYRTTGWDHWTEKNYNIQVVGRLGIYSCSTLGTM